MAKLATRSARSGTPAPGPARSPAKARTLAPANHPLEKAADVTASQALSRGNADVGRQPEFARGVGPSTFARGAALPRSVGDVLGRAGQPLDGATRAYFEPRFGRDFSDVRVHHDEAAGGSARAIAAQAFTAGPHIVFGRGQWQPHSPGGRNLMAHELAHVAQQASHPGASALVWRKPLNIDDFDAGAFSEATLLAYLNHLRTTLAIEDNNDSDDKARGVVRRWREGADKFSLEPHVKVLLVQEMQSGFTGNDDERAILNLLEHSARTDVETMFAPGNLDPEDLDDDFHGAEEDALRSIYDRVFTGGRNAALKGGTPGFKPEKETVIAAPYTHANLRAVIDERMSRIGLVMRDRQPVDRETYADTQVRREAARLEKQITGLPPADRDIAAQDLAADRAQKDSQAKALDVDIGKARTQDQTDILTRKQILLRAEVLMLDLTLQAAYRDIAMAAPSTKATFQALTTPLNAAKKQAAKDAITPVTADEIVAEATGVAPPPPRKFNRGPLTGEKLLYDDKIKARIPLMINEMHAASAAHRTKKEHDDPNLTRSMDEMQTMANRAKDEVDLVFGMLYDKSKVKAFQADKRNKSGTLIKKGNLRDVWQVEEDRRKANPAYAKQSAKFWLFYLIQNDDAVKAINLSHDASPQFDESGSGLNDEAKLIRSVGDPFVTAEKTKLFEIGRAWDAFKQGSDIFIQLFKDPDPQTDRVWLWDMYFTLMHEYLHKLAHKNYHDYADKLGGEHSTEGNTLIEGVDSLLTEIAWASAVQRAGLPEVRKVVEPDAFKAGKPFDPDLLPKIPHRRYATYEQAVRLVGVVGIYNVYAAYFQGRIDLIGGP